jgi:hypothetical protein
VGGPGGVLSSSPRPVWKNFTIICPLHRYIRAKNSAIDSVYDNTALHILYDDPVDKRGFFLKALIGPAF